MTTKYHAKYFAHHITKKGGTGLEKLEGSLSQKVSEEEIFTIGFCVK